jgi:hypothetical protein
VTGFGHDPHDGCSPAGVSRAHSNSAVGSLEAKVKVASMLTVVLSGPARIVVSGAMAGSEAAIAKGDRLSASPHTRPAASSMEVVMSVQVLPSWWRRRTGSVNESGL